MSYRVIQWATGAVGSAALGAIAGHRDLELAGVWVHSAEKEGLDAGDLCGAGLLGVRATRDKEALMKLPADCVCYAVGRAWMQQGKEALLDELCAILRSGKNVVNASWPALVHPKGLDEAVYQQLQAACLEGGASFYTNGIDPGFGSAGIALAGLTVSSNVRCVHMYEILNYATWDDPAMTTFFGYGQPNNDHCMIAQPGFLADIFTSTLRIVAEGMGLELDAVEEEVENIYADEAIDLPSIHVAPGTVSGVRFKVKGMVRGEPRVIIDHVTKLRDEDFPDVPFRSGGGYRAEIEGEPNVRLDLELSSDTTDNAQAALAAVAMCLVNAIPQVCAAPPGVLTYTDLLPHPVRVDS